jgi:hypothetical protein
MEVHDRHPFITDNKKKDRYLPVIPSDPREIAAFYGPGQYLTEKLQRNITKKFEEAFAKEGDAYLDQEEKLLIDVLREKGNHSWMTTLPTERIFYFTDAEWNTAIKLRRNMLPSENIVTCCCGYSFEEDTARNTHFLSCVKFRKTKGYNRHESINHEVTQGCRDAGGIAHSSCRGQSMNESRKIPDGFQEFPEGINYTDVTVCHPLCKTHAGNSNPGKILDKAVLAKHKKYDRFIHQQGAKFTALAMLSYGNLSKEFEDFINRLGKMAKESPYANPHYSQSLASRLKKIVQITCMKGSAKIMLHGERMATKNYSPQLAEYDEQDFKNRMKKLGQEKINEKAWAPRCLDS